jgi:hypothetical protein
LRHFHFAVPNAGQTGSDRFVRWIRTEKR